jgi:membrane associated rhomboid family serine protease
MDVSPSSHPSLLQGSWKTGLFLATGFCSLLVVAFFSADLVEISIEEWGIFPRTTTGLKGIVFTPLIHADSTHLLSNVLSLWVLVALLYVYFPRHFWSLLFFFWLLTGLYTWCLGRPAFHIGASGQVYAIVVFIFSFGIIRRKAPFIAMSLLVVFLYGGFVWGLLPIVPWLSWEAHLSGALTGVVAAIYLRNDYKKEQSYEYDWQKPDYIETFDPESEKETKISEKPPVQIVYHFLSKEDKETLP